MTFAERDPTNPIDRKLRRDQDLRGELADEKDAASQSSKSPGFLWNYIVDPVIEGIGLLGLAFVLAVIAGAIYVWISIFLIGEWPI